MKKTALLVYIIVILFLFQPAASALTAGEARQAWRDLRGTSLDAAAAYRDARSELSDNRTDENDQNVIEKGKEVLHAALNEAEAWLIWRNLEAGENPDIPRDLKSSIQDDVNTNLAKIEGLREDVDEVETKFELAIVFLKMIGKYFEILTDVARNTGYLWVHIGNTKADTIEEYESKLREAAAKIADNGEIIEKLDMAKAELDMARVHISDARSEYDDVRLPRPLLKFSKGNSYLRSARDNLLDGHRNLEEAFRLIESGSDANE